MPACSRRSTIFWSCSTASGRPSSFALVATSAHEIARAGTPATPSAPVAATAADLFYGRLFEFKLRGKSKTSAFIDLGDQFIALQKGRTQPADGGRHFGLVVDDKEAVRKALAEAGVAGAEVYEWNVLVAPAGTPNDVVAKLSAALQKAMDSPDVKARIAQLGGEIQKGGPDAAQAFVRSQMSVWGRVVKERGITLE